MKETQYEYVRRRIMEQYEYMGDIMLSDRTKDRKIELCESALTVMHRVIGEHPGFDAFEAITLCIHTAMCASQFAARIQFQRKSNPSGVVELHPKQRFVNITKIPPIAR